MSSSVNVMVELPMTNWAGLGVSGASFSLSVYSFAWRMATTIYSRISSTGEKFTANHVYR